MKITLVAAWASSTSLSRGMGSSGVFGPIQDARVIAQGAQFLEGHLADLQVPARHAFGTEVMVADQDSVACGADGDLDCLRTVLNCL